jgi:asparagine synthase (glutamine-hydrolysing)
MCGFIGYIQDSAKQLNDKQSSQLKEMADIITHRGPDDEGFYADEHIRFGFRRLSIIDIESGSQPLSYHNGRYWIIFNGEIYNYVELREELTANGYTFETDSDTETILALYQYAGEGAFKRLRGMFSFLIWDQQEQFFIAARDPFGIKPFYYWQDGDKLYCASEKKSILLAKGEDVVDEEALQHYLTYQFVPEPASISKDIKKLPPGHFMKKKLNEPISIHEYWAPTFEPKPMPMEDHIEEIRNVLRDSVKVHMRSDVPVGSFLSGGIDSTAIVALAAEINPNIKTFTVGFEREGFSEIDVAKQSAELLNVENIHRVVTAQEYMDALPKIVWHLDDPVADPALVPLYFISEEARKHVTVVLSGEGSDELFGGYRIYQEAASIRSMSELPKALQKGLRALSTVIPEGVKGKSFIERGTMSIEDRYIGNAKMFTEQEKKSVLKTFDETIDYRQVTKPLYEKIKDYDDVNKMQFIDMHTWLRGDILVKADKMTMAHSLELRVPFLDVEVFNVASKLDSSIKVTKDTTKYILREAMKGIVPDEIFNRPKLGFPVPLRHWLKNEMFDWAKEVIAESETDKFIDKEVVLQLLEDHRQGKADYSRKIWTVLIFMIWHQIYIEKKYDFNYFSETANTKKAMSIS